MTSQERPVEEHNEVDEQIEHGSVAVADHELPAQPTQEEQAETAEPTAASSTTDGERASATVQPVEAPIEQAVERAVGELAATEAVAPDAEPATQAVAPEALVANDAVAEEASVAPVAEATPEAVAPAAETVASGAESVERAEPVEPEVAAPEAEAVGTSAAVAEEASAAPVAEATPEAVAPAAETVALTGEDVSAAAAPGAETTPEAVATQANDTAEEASFTPVVETDSGKPRRVKDLQPGMELEGRVTSIALYGIFVDIGVGRDGLVHISEMSNTRIDSPSDIVQIGDTVHVRVKSVEPDGRRISLTMRTADAPTRRGRKKPELDRERLANLRVGDTIEGTVTGIAPFGVFVDIGAGKDGLVHISELAEGRVDKAEDAVQIGQSYTFKILEVDAEGTRISLSLRRAQRAQRMQDIEKGQIMEGTISGLAPFGAFVDIGVGRDGLVHISELAENRIGKVEDVVKVGDKVQVRVLEMDTQSKRISLSLLLEDRPVEAPAPREAWTPRPERAPREEQPRNRRDERRRDEPRQPANPTTEVYASGADDADEAAPANATLDDLLSKFGSSNKRDKRRRYDEPEEEDEVTRDNRRQREAIRRTLGQSDEE